MSTLRYDSHRIEMHLHCITLHIIITLLKV